MKVSELTQEQHEEDVEVALLSDVEGKLLSALALMSADKLVEYVLQHDYYTSSDWEEVAQLELDRRGLSDLPKQKQAAWLAAIHGSKKR